MTERYLISQAWLEALFTSLTSRGTRILAPKTLGERVELGEVGGFGEVASGHLQSIMSAKAAVFPKVERILGYQTRDGSIAIDDPQPSARPTVVFGVRPCEAR